MKLSFNLFLFTNAISPLIAHADYNFDLKLLGENPDININEFIKQHPPGTYLVDILMNDRVVDTGEYVFESDNQGNLNTCLSKAQLISYGINIEEYPALFTPFRLENTRLLQRTTSESCADISAIPHASVWFDFYAQQLRLSVPQVALKQDALAIVPNELWDDGIPAFLMNYQVGFNRTIRNNNSISYKNDLWSATLEPGINLGPWRLRNSSSWQPGEWQYAYTYAERGINRWQSRLVLGERFTSSTIFDGVPFTGAMLATDDDMLPYEQRIYSPVVRGTARTQARLEVRQNGYLIYSTTVSPGPFEFSDIPISGSQGDLEVTILETDGSPQVFNVIYAIPAIALREGTFKYDIAGGHYRSATQGVDKVPLGQLSLMYGLPLGITFYGGGQWSSNYYSHALGIGSGLGNFGALSVDATRASWDQYGSKSEHGGKLRLLYSKHIDSTNSWLSIEKNYYSSSGFRTMGEVLDSNSEQEAIEGNKYNDFIKENTSIIMGQSLASFGNLNVSAIYSSYRQSRPADKSLRISYSASFKKTSVSLDWSTNYRSSSSWQNEQREQLFGLRLSYPLSFGYSRPVYMSYQLRGSDKQPLQHELGVKGYAFERRMNWDFREQITVGKEQEKNERSLINLGWNHKYGLMNGGYGYSNNSKQMNANISGGIILHEDGLTLGQPLGQTVGLVVAPEANNMAVGLWPGVSTDDRGYAALSSLTPYHYNEISVDPSTLRDDVTLSETEKKVVPTTGAIVPVRFTTRKGASAIIHLSRADGSMPPFGSVAVIEKEKEVRTGMSVGIVGDRGNVYLSGISNTGRLLVRWGGTDTEKCFVDYDLSTSQSKLGNIYEMHAVCQ
ncbi:fimbria/pilus outer membrane usher protein [Aeromonas sp. R5-4]|uniref:fimbria/pilus outer membrane usher protein n=1 Tax=Aeromonas sp. R5-4 TaxID=3138470 RepID=UPI0034A2D76A